jgi:hypothetical protein
MKNRIILWLLKCYPSGWRSEYGAEMEDLLNRQQLTFPRACDVLGGALRERVRQPRARFVACSGLMFIAFFMPAVFCSSLLWRLVAAPVAEVLRNQNTLPPMLLATLPWEQALVIWFGIPLLLTLFVVYPGSLALACRGVLTSRADKAAAARSATLYAASFTAGLVAWQCGSFRWLIRLLQQSPNMRPVSVGECFGLLAASTLGTAIVMQLPLVLHWWHSRPGSFEAK